MKKLLSLLMLLCLTLTVAPAALAEEVVNVYNWEDYIAPEVLTLFTEETGIKVNYMCFTTNEDMIVQVEANPGAFDVCFPSDYIIERMIAKDLLAEIKEETSTAIILITHDLGVVASMADRVAVMYAGKIVEMGTCEDIFYRNAHPYTQALLKSLPSVDADKKDKLVSIPGTPPDLLAPPKGCAFAARCSHCMKLCHEEQPPEFTVGDGHYAACWLLHEDCPSPEERGDKADA